MATQMTCYMWRSKGKCPSGSRCKFAHPGSDGPPAQKTSTGSNSIPWTSKRISGHKADSNPTFTSSPSFTKIGDPDFILKGSGALIATLEPCKAEDDNNRLITIQNANLVASYNWLDVEEPSILVPGHPPKLVLPKLPFHISKETGKVFIDQNAARSPAYTYDALFNSILTMSPGFDMSSIKLVTDRSNFVKLLAFVSDRKLHGSGREDREWRMDVDIVNGTMFLTRWSRIVVRKPESNTFGYSLPPALSEYQQGFEKSTSHHRVMQYNLAGIECLVRFEVDAYVEDEKDGHESDGSAGSSLPEDGWQENFLTEVTKDEKISSKTEEATDTLTQITQEIDCLGLKSDPLDKIRSSKHNNALRILPLGTTVPPSHVAEIKSATHPSVHAIRCWTAQIPTILVARHFGGLISDDIDRLDMATYCGNWEMEQQEHLRSFVRVIEEIRDAVHGIRGKKGMVVFKAEEKLLNVYERKGWDSAVPAGMKDKLWK